METPIFNSEFEKSGKFYVQICCYVRGQNDLQGSFEGQILLSILTEGPSEKLVHTPYIILFEGQMFDSHKIHR